MKVVILAGGFGTRLSEETEIKPKPMVEIGGRPILWHIMKGYARHGFNEFVIALGYKGESIKEYFLNYPDHNSDLTVQTATGHVSRRKTPPEDWIVHLQDTGLETITGGRVKRLAPFLTETFMLTYGDGVADVDLPKLLAFHRAHGKLATLTAVRPPARFGALELDGDRVTRFHEKPQAGEGWINGGFFVMEPGVLEYIDGDAIHLEREPLERLAQDGQLMVHRHAGFWQPMDTLRDVRQLNAMWSAGKAPWKTWES
ncbi:MAG TPA: glucose-1-phosphate cytidylyltransferase [Polyangia bacterium]|nr:glucose-1-phosphate cytidylyltransferase [Polyangia bacterium]